MKKTLLTVVAVMFFMFPVMVNASEADIFDKMLNDAHNKLQETITTDENTLNTELFNEIANLEDTTMETSPIFGGVLTSVADYVPSISVSVLSSGIKVTGIDVVVMLSILIGAITLVLISRKNLVKLN